MTTDITRKLIRLADFTSVLLILYMLLAAIPLSLIGFAPGGTEVRVDERGEPRVTFFRMISRDLIMQYSVVIRDPVSQNIHCQAGSVPFWYHKQSGTIVRDIKWWAPGDSRCWNLPPGRHVMTTCWEWKTPMPFLPDKIVCRDSNIFEIPSKASLAD